VGHPQMFGKSTCRPDDLELKVNRRRGQERSPKKPEKIRKYLNKVKNETTIMGAFNGFGEKGKEVPLPKEG